ncbi:hypothetical protein M0811_00471 [Anaeramoeba ignava]|uniref:Uncharacterized protein n=1 Tax=Anaeramoeba ignava TaxID=1746090 RepID=A0A9Q0LP61_ANAIG|nr:hypothetical protein M0811_00471 [Anaeramoeba ignava]
MKLGIAYNVFDGEELLEFSIKSIRKNAKYIVIIYQKISNFGEKCNSELETLLEDLKKKKLVDEIVLYTPKTFSDRDKLLLVSQNRTKEEVKNPLNIPDQFFNELLKRELGRTKCYLAGCSHFLLMDTDEFYLSSQVQNSIQIIEQNDYESTTCYQRYYFKKPIWELLPYDDLNCVPFIHKIDNGKPLRIASPYPVLTDPTRRMENCSQSFHFTRDVVEMHHMSFVRKNMKSKITNVSNKANFDLDPQEFLKKFEKWEPSQGVLHPHPYFQKYFKSINIVENIFDIEI